MPTRYPGGGRKVYPGFVQLAAFMSMNIDRHRKAHLELYENLAKGELEKAKVTKDFYDEYFAVLDLVGRVLPGDGALGVPGGAPGQGRADLPRPAASTPAAIRRTALLTVEGERDDICALGQTSAAHDLCTGLKPYMKRHHMQAGVGHYGVFSGKRWEDAGLPDRAQHDAGERVAGAAQPPRPRDRFLRPGRAGLPACERDYCARRRPTLPSGG